MKRILSFVLVFFLFTVMIETLAVAQTMTAPAKKPVFRRSRIRFLPWLRRGGVRVRKRKIRRVLVRPTSWTSSALAEWKKKVMAIIKKIRSTITSGNIKRNPGGRSNIGSKKGNLTGWGKKGKNRNGGTSQGNANGTGNTTSSGSNSNGNTSGGVMTGETGSKTSGNGSGPMTGEPSFTGLKKKLIDILRKNNFPSAILSKVEKVNIETGEAIINLNNMPNQEMTTGVAAQYKSPSNVIYCNIPINKSKVSLGSLSLPMPGGVLDYLSTTAGERKIFRIYLPKELQDISIHVSLNEAGSGSNVKLDYLFVPDSYSSQIPYMVITHISDDLIKFLSQGKANPLPIKTYKAKANGSLVLSNKFTKGESGWLYLIVGVVGMSADKGALNIQVAVNLNSPANLGSLALDRGGNPILKIREFFDIDMVRVDSPGDDTINVPILGQSLYLKPKVYYHNADIEYKGESGGVLSMEK